MPIVFKTDETSNIPEWMDQSRELAYAELTGILEKRSSKEIQTWFVEMTNSLIDEKERPLKLDEITSLNWYEVESKSASEIAGIPISRPVLIFSKVSEYQNFSKKLQPDVGNSSRGMVIPGEVFPESSPLHRTGLIIGTSSEEFISHEVFHTIDPNLYNREGYHQCISEISTYLNQNRDMETGELPERAWKRAMSEVSSDIYYESFSKRAKNKLTSEEYRDVVQKSMDILKRIYEEKGYIEMQKKLLTSKTVLEVVM